MLDTGDSHILRSRNRNLTYGQSVFLLFAFFATWKLILLTILASAPGPGYDTSTSLLLDIRSQSAYSANAGEVATTLPYSLKAVRWDAIYFAQIAQRGYVFEQESAFGPGFAKLLAYAHTLFASTESSGQIASIATLGVAISTFLHFLSVLLVHSLSRTILGRLQDAPAVSTAIAALHIINPAGAFLISPYSESLFSTLNFLGLWLYASSLARHNPDSEHLAELKYVTAGCVFGLATTVRSNGLLNGAPLLYDAVLAAASLPLNPIDRGRLRHLIVVCASGVLVALGAIIPQVKAYEAYCFSGAVHTPRPWCRKLVPSIYTWVQSYYWNVGLLRYWTVSNVPLFVIAAPTLYILLASSIWAWSAKPGISRIEAPSIPQSAEYGLMLVRLRRFALPQGLLAAMALLSYHVQIITRLSSAYPLWYIWLAFGIRGPMLNGNTDAVSCWYRYIVHWMVVYAMVQCVLFASFLPPA